MTQPIPSFSFQLGQRRKRATRDHAIAISAFSALSALGAVENARNGERGIPV